VALAEGAAMPQVFTVYSPVRWGGGVVSVYSCSAGCVFIAELLDVSVLSMMKRFWLLGDLPEVQKVPRHPAKSLYELKC